MVGIDPYLSIGEEEVGKGTSLKALAFADISILALLESDDQIVFKKL